MWMDIEERWYFSQMWLSRHQFAVNPLRGHSLVSDLSLVLCIARKNHISHVNRPWWILDYVTLRSIRLEIHHFGSSWHISVRVSRPRASKSNCFEALQRAKPSVWSRWLESCWCPFQQPTESRRLYEPRWHSQMASILVRTDTIILLHSVPQSKITDLEISGLGLTSQMLVSRRSKISTCIFNSQNMSIVLVRWSSSFPLLIIFIDFNTRVWRKYV